MSASDPDPLVFANRILHMMLRNLFAEKYKVAPPDYLRMRVVFRKLGGSWQDVWDGDPDQVHLLQSIVKAWGNMPGHANLSSEVV